MKIKFCGATIGVTGSCHLLTTDRHSVLLDCGQFQGNKEMDALNWEPFPFDPEAVEAVILSHAHIDHCGRIPLLVKRGFKGDIYCTDATADLLQVMLLDSAYIHEKDAEWQTKKNARTGKPPVEPLYTVQDAERSLKLVKPILYDQLVGFRRLHICSQSRRRWWRGTCYRPGRVARCSGSPRRPRRAPARRRSPRRCAA